MFKKYLFCLVISITGTWALADSSDTPTNGTEQVIEYRNICEVQIHRTRVVPLSHTMIDTNRKLDPEKAQKLIADSEEDSKD